MLDAEVGGCQYGEIWFYYLKFGDDTLHVRFLIVVIKFMASYIYLLNNHQPLGTKILDTIGHPNRNGH